VIPFILQEGRVDLKASNEQTERVTLKRVKIDDEIIALDVVRRADGRFVFEIVRDDSLVAWLRAAMNTRRPRAQPGRESRSGSGQSSLR
jgi:hypothetical protein